MGVSGCKGLDIDEDREGLLVTMAAGAIDGTRAKAGVPKGMPDGPATSDGGGGIVNEVMSSVKGGGGTGGGATINAPDISYG